MPFPSAMASPGPLRRYHFGPFALELEERRLLKDGATVALRPRAFDLLAALVDRAGHLVTKDELLDRVWPKVVVEETALRVQLSALRKVLGADTITTVSGQGYRFTLPVTKREAETQLISTPRHNLPHQLTSFIGREQEIAQLKEQVSTNRLVTLTGAGGAGKTRLAIEVARQLLDVFPDGVWLAELAALSDAQLVPRAVAEAVGLNEQPARPAIETLSDYLASKRILLVLDNVEHLLEGCVQFVDLIVRRCPHVAMVVTSRERLGMTGEMTYRVPSLTVPGPSDNVAPDGLLAYEGARLFVARAKLARPDFDLTVENASGVASICTRLDGIPLAIELAAPRLRSMSVVELSQGLDHRFALLIGGSRTALPRQRTLRSTIDWSYDLLREPEKVLLQRLSVFAGGWTLAAAEAVCAGAGIEQGDVLELLTSLADKSLVVPEQGDAQTRYRLLETVRQYAREKLDDDDGSAAVRLRHRDYFLALAEEADSKLKGAEQPGWLRRLQEEHDNLRAGLEWSLVEAEPKGGLRLCGALQRFWWTRGHFTEGRQWCTRVLRKAGAEERTRDRAKVLNEAGGLAFHQGDFPAARALLEESLAILRELGDRPGIAVSLNTLGNVVCEQADYPAGRAMYEQSLAIHRELGERHGIALVLGNMGSEAVNQGDYPAAKAMLEESLAIRRELGDRSGIAGALSNLGHVALNQGDHPAARALYEESMSICREIGERQVIPYPVEGLAAVAASLHDSLRAARIWGAAERSRAEIGAPLSPNERPGYDRRVAAARIASGDDAAFDRAWEEGRCLTLDQAIELALAKPVEGLR